MFTKVHMGCKEKFLGIWQDIWGGMGAIQSLHLICSISTAFIFVIIVILIAYKFNKVFAGVYLVTFWLSPWVVNFARNLYWIEFTWFIPMVIGLFCALKIDDRKCRLASS